MTFAEYQKQALSTALYPDVGHNYVYPSLGLAGESGEVANKVKKIIRDQGGVLDKENCLGILSELGDTLWYLSQLSYELGFSLDDVAGNNLKKLAQRQKNHTLQGVGDNR